MGGGKRIIHETLRGPSLPKELCYAAGAALVPACYWMWQHRETKNRRRHFYEMLDRGEISVVVDE